ncbi:MAG: hypothetical protein KF764_28855 [Labilithrix sp.]|nr:hypothetical protein [Labilithrix sp.]
MLADFTESGVTDSESTNVLDLFLGRHRDNVTDEERALLAELAQQICHGGPPNERNAHFAAMSDEDRHALRTTVERLALSLARPI